MHLFLPIYDSEMEIIFKVFNILMRIISYSLVPKERHVRKEGHGCTLRLCIGCNESHDSTFGQSIDPKERHV